MRKIAFTFHSAEQSGASMWLARFLVSVVDRLDPKGIVPVLPGESPMISLLEGAGYRPIIVPISGDSLTASGGKLSVGINRMHGLSRLRKLFITEKVSGVYINSCVQVAPAVAARTARIPYLVHVHEAWNTGTMHPLKCFFVRRGRAAIFAAQSAMPLFGGPKPNWHFSPNGPASPVHVSPEQRKETRRALQLDEGAPVLFFAGSLIRRKGVHDLLAVWPSIQERHPAAQLLVAGLPVEGEAIPGLQELLDGRTPGARYLGFRKDVAALLAAADLLVLPSYGEAMPLSIVEAMHAWTPVVARTVGDVGWLLEDGRGFPFSGDGPEPLREALFDALSDATLMGTCAENARVFAAENLTMERQTNQILSIMTGAFGPLPTKGMG